MPSSLQLLHFALEVLGLLFAVTLAALFGHGLWMVRTQRRAAVPLALGREALLAVAAGEPFTEEDFAVLESLPRRYQIRLFVELAASVAGANRGDLNDLARRLGITEAGERLCRSRLWWRRLRGVRLLAAVGGGEGVVPGLFRDASDAVRAEAVEWAADHPSAVVVRALLELLPEPQGAAGFALRDSLLRIGAPVVQPLEEYMETHGGTAAEAALEVAVGLPDSRFTPAALRLTHDASPGVRARAAALTGAIGGDAAVSTLTRLLEDSDAGVRAAAARSLGLLGHWPAAPVIARLLRDGSWDVRREAGLALRSLGSPGQLLLRRALEGDDAFAADMARQVLDLPRSAAGRRAG
ncbi:MAG TPA: HEAT repeat domain-containing protein [Longimicrobiaceae bacterium]|nr:HEAT repeat domain-containing protein [Longimicrobiaceae bacterium]